ncbi:hypothetical protein [Lacticaseibacillus sharpeae]|uniref:Uncharacterized protein n=1 Tax=Lacticaseibacillus sharpeae JCM 1186 = DSM 20505 TaxID=1291052 RepID=A0A0R1ZML0_9LACO|nr:hypothetical protein [Lacticaseibacillus sharpeae]KRM56221.1 hypothetical protein FC18_GL000198 [Lacticaseibacillus sharpeae JCM 1186 = DSM 20505]
MNKIDDQAKAMATIFAEGLTNTKQETPANKTDADSGNKFLEALKAKENAL